MTDPNPDDVLFAFSIEPRHDRTTLEQYLRVYPALAEDLIDLAHELRMAEELGPSEDVADAEEAAQAAWLEYAAALPRAVEDVFVRFKGQSFVALANRLNVPRSVLSATFSKGFMTGIPGASGGTLTFSTAGIGAVVFTSDFLIFGDPQDFSFGFTALTPPLAIAANGQIDDFRADGSGTFSAEIPEPATLALVCLGFIAICAHRRKTF